MSNPTAIEVAEAIKAVLETTPNAGIVRTDVAYNLETREYQQLAMDSAGLVDGWLIEIGPCTRTPKGRDLLEDRTFLLTCMVAYRETRADGKRSYVYFGEKVDAGVDAISASPRLGFGNGAAPYPTANVRHFELQEPQGQTRLQGDLGEVHLGPFELRVRTVRC